MSKKNILLCYFTIGGTSYYYDFAEELLKNGNKVLHWNFHGSSFSKHNQEKILEKIAEFKPDLIFSYNNICPEDVIKSFQVPVLVLDADNPEFFHNKDLVNKYDLFYLGYQSSSAQLYEKILGAKISDKNYLFFPTATNFKKDPAISRDKNITFIGSNFYRDFFEGREITDEERDVMLSLTKEIKKNYYYQNPAIDQSLINFTKYFLAGQERLKYLSCVSDLGLEIYSNSDWRKLFTHDLELVNCYKEQIIITKQDNQDLYNSSKISINLSHIQAINSFSWRVPDIMASNSCLVMEDKVDWNMIFGEHISDMVKKSIIYKDQYDMRSKCINLLKDEDLRLRCAEECQHAIEKNGRWKKRIESLESFLNIQLLISNCPKTTVHYQEDTDCIVLSYDLLQEKEPKITAPEETENCENSEPSEGLESQIQTMDNGKKNNSRLQNKAPKSRLALFLRSLVVAIYFVPILGKLFISKKKVYKIMHKISEKLNKSV